jgi:hypothetical protein
MDASFEWLKNANGQNIDWNWVGDVGSEVGS